MPTKTLTTSVRRREEVAVIDLKGEINAAAENTLNDAYAKATTGDQIRGVLLNFADVDYINSTGIALIVSLLAKARQSHTPLMTCSLSDHYREIFEITRLSDFMSISSDEETAVAAFVD